MNIPTRFPLRSGGTTGGEGKLRVQKTCERSTSTFACAVSPVSRWGCEYDAVGLYDRSWM